MAETQRLFFALWPEPAIQEAIARAGRKIAEAHGVRGRFLPSVRIHLTLLFLGSVDANRVPALAAAAGAVTGAAFDLRLCRAGSFRRSAVLWLGPDPIPPPLTALWLQLRDRVQATGCAFDRLNLSPHVTVLRDADKGVRPEDVEPVAWPVRDFVLVESVPGQAPAYRILHRWPLQA